MFSINGPCFVIFLCAHVQEIGARTEIKVELIKGPCSLWTKITVNFKTDGHSMKKKKKISILPRAYNGTRHAVYGNQCLSCWSDCDTAQPLSA